MNPETSGGSENERAGRALRGLVELPDDALITTLGAGGVEVAAGLIGEDVDAYVLDGFESVAALARIAQAVVALVDDGTSTAEQVAAAAWALMATDPARLVIVAPTASRYLEVLVPPRSEVHTLRRYVPIRPESPPSAPERRRRPLPERAGRPWSAEEEQRLAALIRDHTPLEQIAATLGRTRGAVSSRIAQLAVRTGSLALPETAEADR